jgi:ComF family protein
VARHFSVPLAAQLCQRHVDTPQQSELPAGQRAKNLRNAFSLRHAPQIKSIAIVDDVVTTGATVNALAKLMKQNGVEKVQVWSVARTPLR